MSTARAAASSTAASDAAPSAGGGPEVAEALKALAHPARWKMMSLIHRGGGEICVCEFGDHLELSQPTISHHLKTLREAGLVESRQEGTWVYHTIRRDAVAEIAALLEHWAQATGGPGCECGDGPVPAGAGG